jgi:hypothetical protein
MLFAMTIGNRATTLRLPLRWLQHLVPGRDAVRTVALPEGSAWSSVVGAAASISPVEGEVWLTFEGDLEDHVLRPGMGFETPRAGRVAVLALSAACVRVNAPP